MAIERQLDITGPQGPEDREDALRRLRWRVEMELPQVLELGGSPVVFGTGAPDARLMIVGDAAAEPDTHTRRPFSGPAGDLLRRWLEQAGLAEERVWLTNVVKFRPTEVADGQVRARPPRASEVKVCRAYLEEELSILLPRVVLCVGEIAARTLLDRHFRLEAQHGQWRQSPEGWQVTATYPPADVLPLDAPERDRVEALVRQDLDAVRRALPTSPPA